MTTVLEAQSESVSSPAAESLPDAAMHPMPKVAAPPASSCPDQCRCGSQEHTVGAPTCADQRFPESQNVSVSATLPDRRDSGDAQTTRAVGQLNGSQDPDETQTKLAAVELLFCAAFLDDVEKLRIATENRMGSLADEGLNVDLYDHQAHALRQLEKQATLSLERAVRRHPLGPWIKRTVGVGPKQGARLIAAIGPISYNHAADRPRRGPAELWAYCGFRPGQRRRKGVQSNWNAQAKMRAFLIADKAIMMNGKPDKNGKPNPLSPFRADYDRARANWADRDVSDGHKHNHALRVTAKAVLRELFIEARKVGA